MELTLSLTAAQHTLLRLHLFPGDGNEAAAIILCGRRSGVARHRLRAQKIYPIPHAACIERTPVSIVWPTQIMEPWLPEADRLGLSLVKIHSHPGVHAEFSATDDESDGDLFPCIDGWIKAEVPHASLVMLPDGRMFGRVARPQGRFARLHLIAIVGDDLLFWRPRDFGHEPAPELPEFTKRHAKAFGARTTRALRELSVAVIGCSGTGSPTVAQLAHLGVRRLVLVDPDRVRELNLNRILTPPWKMRGRSASRSMCSAMLSNASASAQSWKVTPSTSTALTRCVPSLVATLCLVAWIRRRAASCWTCWQTSTCCHTSI